jgi:cell wall-associated NlpC family hydrolase
MRTVLLFITLVTVVALTTALKGTPTYKNPNCIKQCTNSGWFSEAFCKSYCAQMNKDAYVESDSSAYNGQNAAIWARSKVGGCYDLKRRNGPCFDSSSFVYNAWKLAGKNIKAKTSAQYPGNTVKVNDLQPGDILWRNGHVGIYVGNNEVVNAEGEAEGITLRLLADYKTKIGFTAVYRPK